MEIDHCIFPDDLLYDTEDNTWVKIADGIATVGVTTVLIGISGKLVRAALKPMGSIIERGQSLGTLESERFVGPVRSPLSGVLTASNLKVQENPTIVNESCYREGWIVQLETSKLSAERILLSNTADSRLRLSQTIALHHVRCFKAFPDRDMYEIGTECSAVLVRLNDQLGTMAVGEVIHLVSDDPTAYVEMVAWADRTGQSLVDWRKEGNLYHFIVKKIR